MHSLKSTAIAVALLAVSIGLYQVSSTEDNGQVTDLSAELGIDSGYANFPTPHVDEGDAAVGGQVSTPVGRYPMLSSNTAQVPSDPIAFSQASHSSVAPSTTPSFSANTAPSNRPVIEAPALPPQTTSPPNLAASNLAAPSFADLKNQFQNSSSNSELPHSDLQASLQSAKDATKEAFSQRIGDASDAVQNIQAKASSSLDSMQAQLQQSISGKRDAVASQFQDLQLPEMSSPQTTIRKSLENRSDDGLIQALQTEIAGHQNDVASGVAPLTNQLASTAQASRQMMDDFMPELSSSAPAKLPSTNQTPTQQTAIASPSNARADSEFSAQPIGSVPASKTQLASGHREQSMDQFVQQANVVPESDNSALAVPSKLNEAWPVVEKMVADQKFQLALETLTKFYRQGTPDAAQRRRMYEWLDALAGKVIYSTEHHIESKPYIIRAGETLADIANRWQVSPQVIYNINRQTIGTDASIVAGTELKQIRGPFHGEVSLTNKTLTLYLDNLYAGRFPIRIGISGEPGPGDYRVVAKSVQGQTWRDADGNDFPPESSENGYGPYWLGLSGSLCIHAVPDSTLDGHPGCIGLREKDAKDVFGILTNAANLKIVR